MKKYFILAVAALIASAACTKVETFNNAPDTLIGFNVAKYMTKATNSLLDEQANGSAIESFVANAWFYTANEAAQRFMTDQSVAPDNTANPTKWSPVGRSYYWPKTGYINFFSYAGHPAASTVKEDTIAYNAANIVRTSNILVADAAYGYSENTDPAVYGDSGATKGVPTLFHHVLSRVKFDVKLDVTENTDANYVWTATVDTAFIDVPQVGSLKLSFTKPADIAENASVVPFNATSWTNLGGRDTLNKVPSVVELTANGGEVSSIETLIDEGSVIPHTIYNAGTDSVCVSIAYTIVYQYQNETPIREHVRLSNVALKDFAPSITSWAMNKRYLYHITIKPRGEILFDPAVETWVEEAEQPSYTYTD